MKAAQIAVVLVPMLVHLLKKEQACLYLAFTFGRHPESIALARLLQVEVRPLLQMDEQPGGDANTIIEMKLGAGNLEVGFINPKRAGKMAGEIGFKTACTVATTCNLEDQCIAAVEPIVTRIAQGHHAKQMLNGVDVHSEFVPESVVLRSLDQGANARFLLVEILVAQWLPIFADQAADRMAMNEERFFFSCLGFLDVALRVELVLGDVGGVGVVFAYRVKLFLSRMLLFDQ